MRITGNKFTFNSENGDDAATGWFKGVDFSKIPIVIRASDEKGHSSQIGFRVMSRLVKLAHIIRENSPLKCYKTASDVYQHALYLGLQMIYHLGIKKRINPNYGLAVYKLLIENQKLLQEMSLLEDVEDTFKKLADRFKKGFLTLDELKTKAKQFIDAVPSELKQDTQTKLNRIIMEAQLDNKNTKKIEYPSDDFS